MLLKVLFQLRKTSKTVPRSPGGTPLDVKKRRKKVLGLSRLINLQSEFYCYYNIALAAFVDVVLCGILATIGKGNAQACNSPISL